jgi:hypothetical protein
MMIEEREEPNYKNSWYNVLFVILLTLIIIFILYSFLFYKYNENIIPDNEKLAQKFQYGPLQSLLNGSGINNIPTLNLISTNVGVNTANNCGKGPVATGTASITDSECVRICANSTAKALLVHEEEQYFYESSSLNAGAYCIIGARPECDTRTTIVLMTINSVVCRSKFPRIVGGTLGTQVVACNNRTINDHNNILWDYKYNERFDPVTTTILDEDEMLPDGTYRYRCKFGGMDDRGNNFQEHPFDRFHPISNYCASLIYRAHPDVKTKFINNVSNFECDCGNYEETRVRNIISRDKTSLCSPYSFEVRTENDIDTITIPYPCFTMFSPITDVGKYFPCPADKFTREGVQMNTVSIRYTGIEETLLEHPLYRSFSSKGAEVSINRVL